mmetsp:Transcript_8413/g.27492  ORF Transcript_8413/g.27492 Transcript_8413/m.27492 type:complete len:546 (-) Transcript_8413:152-1789(-)
MHPGVRLQRLHKPLLHVAVAELHHHRELRGNHLEVGDVVLLGHRGGRGRLVRERHVGLELLLADEVLPRGQRDGGPEGHLLGKPRLLLALLLRLLEPPAVGEAHVLHHPLQPRDHALDVRLPQQPRHVLVVVVEVLHQACVGVVLPHGQGEQPRVHDRHRVLPAPQRSHLEQRRQPLHALVGAHQRRGSSPPRPAAAELAEVAEHLHHLRAQLNLARHGLQHGHLAGRQRDLHEALGARHVVLLRLPVLRLQPEDKPVHQHVVVHVPHLPDVRGRPHHRHEHDRHVAALPRGREGPRLQQVHVPIEDLAAVGVPLHRQGVLHHHDRRAAVGAQRVQLQRLFHVVPQHGGGRGHADEHAVSKRVLQVFAQPVRVVLEPHQQRVLPRQRREEHQLRRVHDVGVVQAAGEALERVLYEVVRALAARDELCHHALAQVLLHHHQQLRALLPVLHRPHGLLALPAGLLLLLHARYHLLLERQEALLEPGPLTVRVGHGEEGIDLKFYQVLEVGGEHEDSGLLVLGGELVAVGAPRGIGLRGVPLIEVLLH